MVRKITHLGFDAADLLRRHFEGYGPVEEVLLSGANQRPADVPIAVRVRPSGFGFVLMRSAEDAASAFAAGAEQVVQGVVIRVQKFERKAADGLDDEGQDS